MTTRPPQQLSEALADRYRLERALGAGGMATVYLAHDVKHDRKVAIKVLKPELAAVLGGERFVVEIKTTAMLQHPHILPLFDSGSTASHPESQGEGSVFLYYVMPYIQGETIREKLNRETQFGVDDAVRIAREVADALDYAHRHGVIHRDIKPENILLHDGRAMVMDFGIALAVSAAAGGRLTETGLSLGTPHYMSPEQATAEKEITGRSDVYSLGTVLFEMLTGNAPHTGANAQQIIMKIISEPAEPVTKYRRSVPPNVSAAVAKALEKLPADRFDTAKAFADALQNTAFTTRATQAQPATGQWKLRAAVPLAIASVVLTSALAWQLFKPSAPPPAMRFDLATTAAEVMSTSDVVISPDGSMLAYGGSAGNEVAIYLRRLGVDLDFRKIVGTEGVLGTPSFSPDNQWIVFRRGASADIAKISIAGGGATVLERLDGPFGAFMHWGTDQQIIYSGGPTGLRRMAAAGGRAPELLKKTNGAARYAFLLPDGSGLLFSLPPQGVFLLDFKSDSATLLIPGGTHPVYSASGHVLYIAGAGGLFAEAFDLGQHRLTGSPVRVLDNVAAALAQRGFSVANNGTLVYQDGPSTVTTMVNVPTLLLVGKFAGGVDTLRLPHGRKLVPRFSPNGRLIAYEFHARGGDLETDIFTFDLISGTNTRLTFDGDNDDPVWSPDGTRLAFTKGSSTRTEDLFVKLADNSGAERELLSQPGNQNPTAWLNDDTILFQSNAAGQMDLFSFSVTAAKATPYLQAPWAETDLHVARDGKLAAFVSNETGLLDVWVRDFPVAAGKWQVSVGGGRMPRWSPDGRDLYFWRLGNPQDSLYRVRIDRTPTVTVHTPQLVLTQNIVMAEGWDVHPDGKRFISVAPDVPRAVVGAGGTAVSRYVVVQNWFTELKARTAAGKK